MKNLLIKIKPASLLLYCLCFYTLYVILKISSNQVLLSDDLNKIYEAQNINTSFFDFILHFLDSTTMSARPVSGFVTGLIVYLSKFDSNIYFLGLICFPLSIILLHKVLSCFFDDFFSILVVVFYTGSILASSIQFSPIMLNSNLALIFWLFSIYFLKKRYNPILSSIFFLLSVLSYEIFLPLLIVNSLLLKKNRNKFIYFIGTLTFVLLYRKLLQPLIFENSYQRDNIKQFFNLFHLKKVILLSFKMFFRDYFVAFFKGIYNIRFQNSIDLFFPIIIGTSIYYLITKEKLQNSKLNYTKIIILSIALILVSLSIFIFSTYYPTLFGFDNRNLGGARIFLSLLIPAFLILLLKYLKIRSIVFKGIFTAVVVLTFSVNISIMNSWIYANNLNNNIFAQLKIELEQKKITPNNICIDYNVYEFQKSSKFLILREPTFFNNWEAPYLAISNGININKTTIINKERANKKKCDFVFIYEPKYEKYQSQFCNLPILRHTQK